jgi:phosphoenolpyruvate-protein phosphotransferase (PTS system enzyme I)
LLLSPTALIWHARRWVWLRGCCKGQYTFAADRHSAILAQLTDPWQPALLRTIDMIAKAAAATGKPVGICGEAAAHPLLALVLAGLGLSSLSMAPGALAEVGRSMGSVSMEVCQRAARAACQAHSRASAREAACAIAGFSR